MDLPRWVSKSERQPFLYVSPLKFLGRPISGLQGLFLILIGLLTLFLACLRFSLSCFNCKELMETMREHREDHLWRSHLFLIRQILVLLPMATLLFWCYTWHASYYECGRELSKTTLAYFEGGQMAELALACLWSSWSLLCLYHARRIPKPGRHLTSSSSSPLAPSRVCGRCRRNLLLKSAWCALWFMLVVILSLPSLGYAFVQSLPRENSFQMQSTSVLKAVHGGAALLMLLIDMGITPPLARIISRRSGIQRSMLLMAARTGTMWLNATLCAIYMSEHCMRGWTTFWTMCSPQSDLYHTFKVSLGSHELLDPIKDLCVQNKNWWKTEACPRSVVDTLAPLFVAKLLQRAFLQPVITLLLWKWSKEVNGELHVFPLACLGLKRWKLVASRSLDRAQQASFLVTLAEVMIIWSPLVPLLLPVACLAAMTNLLSFRIGPREFRAVLPTLEAGETASMSKKYIRASIGILLIFQMWFAFTSGLCGTSLIVLAAVVFLCEVLGLRSRCRRMREQRSGDRGLVT
ncbi:Putative leucine-rich repeat receptor-like protein kinase, partial [Durusdinium trenchii]